MRIAKLLIGIVAALAITGCACKTKTVEKGDNIGGPGAKSPLEMIHFAFDKYNIDPAAQAILKKNAEWLKTNAGAKVQVEGHCDERGTTEYNMALGQRRAKASFDYFRGLGIDAARMSTVSYGKEKPLDPAHNEAAWAKNRRDEFPVQK